MDDLPPVLVLALVAAAVATYAAFCYFTVAFVLVPAFPYLVIFGGAVGVLVVVGVAVGTLVVPALAAPTVTPSAAAARLPGSRTKFPRDVAWSNYLFVQWRDDLSTAQRHTVAVVAWVWSPAKAIADDPVWLWGWPLIAVALVFVATFTGGVTVAAAMACLVVGAVLGAAWVAWLVIACALRGMDAGVRRLLGAKATCSECSYRNQLPAYRCACGDLHRDIRAGRLGTLARRCACGRLLPTTVMRAVSGLVPQCQNCGHPLRGNAGAVTDISLPVFGPASAGKTRFVLAGMVALDRHLRAVGGTFATLDAHSRSRFDDAVSIVRSRVATDKTRVDEPKIGITVALSHRKRQAYLHLYDAAGELLTDPKQNTDLRFLDDTEGLVFVLDPFSVAAVRDDLRGSSTSWLEQANPADMDPEQSYLVTSQRLANQGVALTRKPLAVAVVKSDLLLGLPCAAVLGRAADSDTIKAWLTQAGLDNFVSGVERDFSEVRYFLVSSLDDAAERDGTAAETSPAHPLLWLLGRSKMSVPSNLEAVSAS